MKDEYDRILAEEWTVFVSTKLGFTTAGCWRCGALSELLANALSLSGINALVVKGKANGQHHVWVQVGDDIYDPTIGQFESPVLYEICDHCEL